MPIQSEHGLLFYLAMTCVVCGGPVSAATLSGDLHACFFVRALISIDVNKQLNLVLGWISPSKPIVYINDS